MHYLCRISKRMQKHKFGTTCPYALFMETAPDPPEHKRECVDVSRPERTEMHYVTGRANRMQKHKFGIKCLDVLFVETAPGPPEHKKGCVDVS
jgi:hypothetical protein